MHYLDSLSRLGRRRLGRDLYVSSAFGESRQSEPLRFFRAGVGSEHSLRPSRHVGQAGHFRHLRLAGREEHPYVDLLNTPPAPGTVSTIGTASNYLVTKNDDRDDGSYWEHSGELGRMEADVPLERHGWARD